jgi:histidine phosphotransfer protein HptB
MSQPNSNSSRAMSGTPPVESTAREGTDSAGTLDKSTDGASTRGAALVFASTVDDGVVSLARIDRLRNSIPGKDYLLDELIDLFISDLPTRLNAIAQAVERADAPALALHAHTLRGSAANFGASRLDELCGRLEAMGVGAAHSEAPAMLDELGRESARARDALLALKSQHHLPPESGSAQKSSGSSRNL